MNLAKGMPTSGLNLEDWLLVHLGPTLADLTILLIVLAGFALGFAILFGISKLWDQL